MERCPTHQLHVEVTLPDHPARCLAGSRESLGEEVVYVLAVLEALFELARLGPEPVVVERLHVGLERVYARNDDLESLQLLSLTGGEDLADEAQSIAFS